MFSTLVTTGTKTEIFSQTQVGAATEMCYFNINKLMLITEKFHRKSCNNSLKMATLMP